MASIVITREKVLEWRAGWSQSDLRVLEEELTRVGAVRFASVENQYVSCRNEAGRVACRIYPGYVQFNPEFVPTDLPDGETWRILSTFQDRSEADPERIENLESCPFCWTRLPLSGVCDCQD